MKGEEGVKNASELQADIGEDIRAMIASGAIDRLVVQLERRFRSHRHLVEDAVLEAIERLVLDHRKSQVRNPTAYVRIRAGWTMLNTVKRKESIGIHQDIVSDEIDERLQQPGPESVAFGHDLWRRTKAILDGWPNRRMAIVTSLHLGALFAGDRLSSSEISEILAADFNEDLTASHVGKLRERGLERIAADLADDESATEELESQ